MLATTDKSLMVVTTTFATDKVSEGGVDVKSDDDDDDVLVKCPVGGECVWDDTFLQ